MAEVKDFIKGFVMGIVGIVVATTLVTGVLLPALQDSNVPLLSQALVGTVVGAGILMFIIGLFF